MKIKTLFGLTLLGLAISNQISSQKLSTKNQDNKNFYLENKAISCPKPKYKLHLSGVGLGAIVENNKYGAILELFYATSKLQLGYVVIMEKNINHHNNNTFLDNARVGINVNYFPLDTKIVRPYIGATSEFEYDSYFVGKQSFEQRGVGLVAKLGTEFRPFHDRRVRPYVELGHNFSVYNQKEKLYPITPSAKFDRFSLAGGVRF